MRRGRVGWWRVGRVGGLEKLRVEEGNSLPPFHFHFAFPPTYTQTTTRTISTPYAHTTHVQIFVRIDAKASPSVTSAQHLFQATSQTMMKQEGAAKPSCNRARTLHPGGNNKHTNDEKGLARRHALF